ncbi:hypothetical protein QE152_g29471 [Popillia japonica]|uniref:Uncharacterized protein n=1 Tax=Popillia japonica TaxID=7064 RepID=A0AAW1JIU4_POPJA
MELRSGRSRSNTPFLINSAEQDVVITGNHVEKVSKTRSTTIKTYENIISSESKHVKLRSKRGGKAIYKTSDYSSEDGEHDSGFSPSQHISDNVKNQLREDTFNSINGRDDVSALKVYKAAGEYWNKFPKTDYTYSKHSKDRVEIAPGVVAMPNMSRRSLHSYSSLHAGITLDKHTNTDSYIDEDSVDYTSSTTNGSGLKQRFIHSNNNQIEEEEEEEDFVIRRISYKRVTIIQRFFQVLISIFTTIFYPVYYIYNKQHAVFFWFVKKLHTIASSLMLLDTWLLQGSAPDRKMSAIMRLCLFPLLLFGGLHVLLASDLTLAFPCHPHCGSIASSYYNSFIDSIVNILENFKKDITN